MRKGVSVGRDNLISLGVCFGKFTKTGKFRLHVTALDVLAQYAKVKNPTYEVCKSNLKTTRLIIISSFPRISTRSG